MRSCSRDGREIKREVDLSRAARLSASIHDSEPLGYSPSIELTIPEEASLLFVLLRVYVAAKQARRRALQQASYL